jgi:hypothetical protein
VKETRLNLDHWSPAQQCHGWTCPCGHHSISAVSPVRSCSKCRTKRAPIDAKRRGEETKRKRRADRLRRKAPLASAELASREAATP